MATPAPVLNNAVSAAASNAADRRLRLEDILKLMVADGLVGAAEAEQLARSRTARFDHPLELIADRKWRHPDPPHKVLTLEALVEWLAGKLGVPYQHIDPLKIDLTAVTHTMSNAYAERYRILRLKVRFVFANAQYIRRYLGEFFTLARSRKLAQETSRGDLSLARNFEQLV